MKRLVFLDRDGVINRFPGKGAYVTRESQLIVMPQALRGLRLLTEAGYDVAVISNQGCVSRGLITKAALKKMTGNLEKKVQLAGGRLKSVYYCYHQTSDHCACKKPKTLLFERAIKKYPIARKKLYFMGDSQEDIQAAKNFGCRSVLLLSGRLKKNDIPKLETKPDFVKANLWEAAKWLIKKES